MVILNENLSSLMSNSVNNSAELSNLKIRCVVEIELLLVPRRYTLW